METSFRQLDANEMELLEKLLSREFPGRDALRLQLSSVTGRRIDDNGSLELRPEEDNPAEIELGCPSEGTCADIDGGLIAVLLHVKNGKMRLLEIFKEDGSEILRPPNAEALSVY
jgi:Domain of unknown function (DUF6984)